MTRTHNNNININNIKIILETERKRENLVNNITKNKIKCNKN